MILYNISKEFPALSPLSLENESFHRVIGLYSDILKVHKNDKKQTQSEPKKKVIRRQAGDDWF